MPPLESKERENKGMPRGAYFAVFLCALALVLGLFLVGMDPEAVDSDSGSSDLFESSTSADALGRDDSTSVRGETEGVDNPGSEAGSLSDNSTSSTNSASSLNSSTDRESRDGFDGSPGSKSRIEGDNKKSLNQRHSGNESEGADPSSNRGSAKRSGSQSKRSASASRALFVRVIHSETLQPFAGANIYLYPKAKTFDLSFAKLDHASAALHKESDGTGIAHFEPKELAEIDLPSLCVVVDHPMVVPERREIPEGKGNATIRVALHPSISVDIKTITRKGDAISDAAINLTQTLGFSKLSMAGKTNGSGELRFRASAKHHFAMSASLSGYATKRMGGLSFKEENEVLKVVLEVGQSISGRVTHEGDPVEGAKVVGERDGLEALTDASGEFEITSVTDQIWTNRIRIRVSKAGLAQKVMDVLANEDRLDIALQKEGIARGTVFDETNTPVPNAKVIATIVQLKKSYSLGVFTCNEEGIFEIKGIGDGTLILKADAGDGRFSPSQKFGVRAAAEVEGLELRLGPGATLIGTVAAVDSSGRPISAAGLQVQLNGKVVTTVGADGSYQVSGLDTGKVSISLGGPGTVPGRLNHLGIIATADGKLFTSPDPKSVSVTLGKETKLDLQIREFLDREEKKITLEFELDSGQDLEDLRILAKPQIENAPNGTKTQLIDVKVKLERGRLTLPVTLLEGVSYSATFTHPSIFPYTLKPEDLASTPHEGTLRIELKQALTVGGTIINSGGGAMPGAQVQLFQGGRSVKNLQSDSQGKFLFGELNAGQYRIRVFKQSYYEHWSEPFDLQAALEEPMVITLFGANEIRITVVQPGGSPQPGARVRLSRPSSDNASSRLDYFNIGETDAKGRKVVNFHWIRHYQIIATHGGNIGFVNFDNIKDQNVREFTLTLEPASHLKGKVVSSTSGQPITQTDVFARLEAAGERGGNGFYIRTGNKGEFNVAVPASGEFTFVVRESRAYSSSETRGIRAPENDLLITAPPKDKVDGNWAEFVSVSAPSEVGPGEEFLVSVTVLNRGSTTWTEASQHRLGSEAPRDNRTWGKNRVSFQQGSSIAPGSSHTFSISVKAPTAPGTHKMQWRMVQDGREWFGEFSEVLSIIVRSP